MDTPSQDRGDRRSKHRPGAASSKHDKARGENGAVCPEFNRTQIRLILLFFAVSFSIGIFYTFRGSSLPQPGGNALPSFMFVSRSHHMPVSTDQLPDFWKSRYVACVLTGWWTDFWKPANQAGFMNVFASFHAVCVFGVLVAMVFGLKNAMVPMFGVVAGIVFNASPELHPYVLPWDMLAMLLFTVASLSYFHKNWTLLIATVFLGGLVKETVLVCALFLLAAPWKWKLRIAMIGGLILLTYLVNTAFMPQRAAPSWVVAMVDGRITHNLRAFVSLSPAHVLFANAGGLLVAVVCLFRAKDWTTLAVFGAYMVGQFFGGQIDEFRVWFEILPTCWIVIQKNLFERNREIAGC